jgi:hypothetical protein
MSAKSRSVRDILQNGKGKPGAGDEAMNRRIDKKED